MNWCQRLGASLLVPRLASPEPSYQCDSIFGQPLVRRFDRMFKALMLTLLENPRCLDFGRNKIFVLQHQTPQSR